MHQALYVYLLDLLCCTIATSHDDTRIVNTVGRGWRGKSSDWMGSSAGTVYIRTCITDTPLEVSLCAV